MPRTMVILSLLAVAALCLAGCGESSNTNTNTNANAGGSPMAGGANGNANANTAGGGALSESDRKFVTAAAEGGMAEVELGHLAEQNGKSDAVKNFGKRMVDDHSKANDELKTVAASKGITLPKEPNAEQRQTKDRLSKLKGDEFDRAYMEDMVKDHTEDVAEFQRESQSGADKDVKGFAAKTLPIIEEHLKMAKSFNPKGQGNTNSK